MLSYVASIYELKLKMISKQISEIINCTENNKINMLKELYKRLIVPLYTSFNVDTLFFNFIFKRKKKLL